MKNNGKTTRTMEVNIWYNYTRKRLIEALNYNGRTKYDILIMHPAYGGIDVSVDSNRIPCIECGSSECWKVFEWYLTKEEKYYPEKIIIRTGDPV